MRLLLLHGPNFALLGVRPGDVPGLTAAAVEAAVRDEAARLGMAEVRYLQTNHEGALLDALHAARAWASGVVLNPGVYGHTSWALREAVASVGLPVVEVQLNAAAAGEPWRQVAVLDGVAAARLLGRGLDGYVEAVRWLAAHAQRAGAPVPSGVSAAAGQEAHGPRAVQLSSSGAPGAGASAPWGLPDAGAPDSAVRPGWGGEPAERGAAGAGPASGATADATFHAGAGRLSLVLPASETDRPTPSASVHSVRMPSAGSKQAEAAGEGNGSAASAARAVGPGTKTLGPAAEAALPTPTDSGNAAHRPATGPAVRDAGALPAAGRGVPAASSRDCAFCADEPCELHAGAPAVPPRSAGVGLGLAGEAMVRLRALESAALLEETGQSIAALKGRAAAAEVRFEHALEGARAQAAVPATRSNVAPAEAAPAADMPPTVRKSIGPSAPAGAPAAPRKTLGRAQPAPATAPGAAPAGLTRAALAEKLAAHLSGALPAAELAAWARAGWLALDEAPSAERDRLEPVLRQLMFLGQPGSPLDAPSLVSLLASLQ